MTYNELFSATWKTIQKDSVILVPNIALMLVFLILETWFPSFKQDPVEAALPILMASLAMQLFAKCITVYLSNDAFVTSPQRLLVGIKNLFFIIPKTFISLSFFAVPGFLLLHKFPLQTLSNADPKMSAIILAIMLACIPISLVLEFIPGFIVINKSGIFTSILDSARFVYRNIKNVLIVTLYGIILLFGALLIASLFSIIPTVGPMFQSVFMGLGYGFIQAFETIFLSNLLKKGTPDNT